MPDVGRATFIKSFSRMKKTSSLVYIYKNFFRLVLIVVLPALFLALFRSDYVVSDFFVNFAKNTEDFGIVDFYGDVFKYFSFINFDSAGGFIGWFVSALIAIVGLGALYSAVERHMRLGVPVSFRLGSLVNDSLVIVLPFAAVAFFSCELLGLVTSGIICLLFLIVKSKIALFIVCLILVIAIYVAYCAFFVLICLSVPASLIDGYSFNYSAATSINLVKNALKRIYGAIAIPLVITVAVIALFKPLISLASPAAEGILSTIGWTVVHTGWMIYFPVLTIKYYMFLTGMEREDMGFGIRRK